jgi:hypothetical protein
LQLTGSGFQASDFGWSGPIDDTPGEVNSGQTLTAATPISGVVVTLTVEDASGNKSTCTATVTVIDDVAPGITCPNDITVSNDDGVCGAYVAIPSPITDDNCGVASVIND